MQLLKKVLPVMLALLLAVTPPGVMASAAVPATWQGVLEEYPNHEVQPFTMPLNQTCRLVWNDVLAQLSGGTPLTLGVFSADGQRLNTEGNDVRLCTGQHASVVVTADTRRANLYDVIILGDVLGTGQLNIAQVTRLANALTGARPLSGPYALAADVDGGGALNIVDLVRLCRWLTGRP